MLEKTPFSHILKELNPRCNPYCFYNNDAKHN